VAATPVASSTSTTIGNQGRNNPTNQLSTTKTKSQLMLIGKKQFITGDHSSQHGPSKPYVGKAVFCIDNVITSATETDIERHIKRMGVIVLLCHAVQPRRSRWQRLRGIVPADRSTFRVCIPREQSHKLLVADAWPANITITAWRFAEKKDTTTAAENASNQLPSSDRQPRESTSGGSHGTSTTTDRSTDHHRSAAAGSDLVHDGNIIFCCRLPLCHCSSGIKEMMAKIQPDIIMAQEHWLTPDNLWKLNTLSDNYSVFSSSAMAACVSAGPLVGRPFGGTAVVNSKHMSATENITSQDRFTAVKVHN